MSNGRTNPTPVCRHSFREIFKKLCQVPFGNGEQRNVSPYWYVWVGGLGLAIAIWGNNTFKSCFFEFSSKKVLCAVSWMAWEILFSLGELSCSLKILRPYLSSWPKPDKSNLPVCGALCLYTPLLYLIHKNNLQISKILPFPNTSNAATWSKSPSFLA